MDTFLTDKILKDGLQIASNVSLFYADYPRQMDLDMIAAIVSTHHLH